MKNNKSRLFIGHESFKTYDDINLSPFLNCGRYGYSEQKFTSPITTKTITNVLTVIDYYVKTSKKVIDTEHIVSDTEKCSSIQI